MLTPDKRKQLQAAMMTIWIIWGAMIASLLLYVVVALLLGDHLLSRETFDPGLLTTLTRIFMAISAALLLVAFFLRRSLLNRQPEMIAEPVQAPPLPTGQYMTNLLICLALCEAIGIFGFVLYMLGGDFTTFVLFIAVGLAGMIYFRPSSRHVEKLMAINSGRQVTNQPLM